MKKQFAQFSGVILLTATLFGCSSSDKERVAISANLDAQQIYEKAKTSMRTGNFSAAAQLLSALDARYPFGPLSNQVQLDLIYSYYKAGDTPQALATIDRFVRLNPNHSDIDYAIYMRGLTNMEVDKNLFQDIVSLDRSDRDPTNSRDAFDDFRSLIQQFPDSKYAADAQKRMLYIKTRLAKYEVAVARFYMRREAFVAAANRGRYIIENYPDTDQIQQALEIMVESYDQLGLDDLKNNAMKTLKYNFPDSSFIS
ncbi:outer membrane protein assembly factor BamD [Alteromonas sp. 5E99-2]|uniref:outer membrane protein assembly factor BamD n=1 Tax=Alteromonas sp. 5E99-2 TaxID=2817683 RepID=UPI001A984195|nr:outer membrane protein assembly factor BamD [Alteromonas sp. 5E99-2]MBO1254070.1 outer membrane protein assembly factor BamD [Alteromonas sp. 5E99-2]